MEHMIQIGFTLDDDRIQQQMEAAAVREVTKRFDEAVLRAARKQRGWGRGYDTFEDAVIDYMQRSIEDFVKDHADEIVAAAGKALADRLIRTKKAREILEGGTLS